MAQKPQNPRRTSAGKIARRCLLSCCCLLAATACGGASAQMESRFAEVTGCSGDIEVLDLNDRGAAKYLVRGCGKRANFYCVDDKCRSPEFEARRRHARDRGCLLENVSAYEFDDDRFITQGCGHKATYGCKTDYRTAVQCTTEETSHPGATPEPN